jgi:hypothetical protein
LENRFCAECIRLKSMKSQKMPIRWNPLSVPMVRGELVSRHPTTVGYVNRG